MAKVPLKSRRRKVLVVEPDRDFCSVVCDFLASRKFEIDSAPDGEQCLARIETFHPDLLLLSRELPLPGGARGPDGLRILKVLKQDRKLRLPVIMFSDEATEADFDRYRKLKFTAEDYVRKPFEDTEILRRIENLVGFDFSDDIDKIQEHIEDAMDDDPLARLFDADPEELGHSAATRKEVARLLEQVGQELDRQEQDLPPEKKEEPAPPRAAEDAGRETAQLRAEVAALRHQMDLAQKQLVSERKRSREIKKEWKQRLTQIEAELQKSEHREQLMREEFEKMRLRFADLELDHTMELERVQGEKRRLLEDLARLQAQDYPPEQLEADLRGLAETLAAMLRKLQGN